MNGLLTSLLSGIALGSVTSQFLVDICSILILMTYIYSLRRADQNTQKSPLFVRTGIEWALFGYFFVAVLSIYFNALDPKPWLTSLKRFTWLFDLYLLSWAFSYASPHLKRWLYFFAFAYILPNIYAFETYRLNFDPLSGEAAGGRVIGLVHSATYHAHGNGLILIFFGSLLIGLWKRLNRKERFWTSLSFLILTASVFLTFTRGIWISVSVSALVYFAFLGRRYFIWGATALISLSVLLFLAFPKVQDRIEGLFEGEHGISVRENLLQANWMMFKDHPLLGIGYWDQYRQLPEYWVRMGLPADSFNSHAHNQYVNVLATTGAAGLFFFLAITIYFLKINIGMYLSAKEKMSKVFLLACLATQVEFYVACLTDVTFEYAKIRALIILVWAMLIAYKRGTLKPLFDK